MIITWFRLTLQVILYWKIMNFFDILNILNFKSKLKHKSVICYINKYKNGVNNIFFWEKNIYSNKIRVL